jgi:hypothetical protein
VAAVEVQKAEWEKEGGFLLDAISCIDRSWQWRSSYGRHEAPLLAFTHTKISNHTMQQVSIVKNKKLSLLMFIR